MVKELVLGTSELMHSGVQQSLSSLSGLLGSFPIPELLKRWGLIT